MKKLFLLLLLSSCSLLKDYPQDNIVEEIAEAVIYDEFHVDIDLSPMTPENHPILNQKI
jgi:hypothetical protein